MKDEVLVKVEGVSKKFCKDLKRSLWYGVNDLSTAFLGTKGHSSKLRRDEFWAISEVSFELKRGECLGLIGHNGAGKSTLLKMLNGLIKPDKGSIMMKGRIAALIELGTGFNPILTGRENIYNNGAVLGFTNQEIEDKFDDIVEFAELNEFIDTPVQNYSSGMKVRLGFAVAAQLEPDVLIIDEVLAVGDVSFRIKSLNRILDLVKTTAVIFVTHSMPQLARVCSAAILLDKGRIESKKTSRITDAINQYLELSDSSKTTNRIFGTGEAVINKVLINGTSKNLVKLDYKDPFIIELDAYIDASINEYLIRISFFDAELKIVGQLISTNDHFYLSKVGKIKVKLEMDKTLLTIGKYSINIAICENSNISEGVIFCRHDNIRTIQIVKNNVYSNSPCLFDGKWQIE